MIEDANKQKAAAQAAGKPAPKKKKSSSRLIISGFLVAALVTGGTAWFATQRGHADQTGTDPAAAVPKYIAHLDGFTVNLADPEESHFLRVTMDIGFDHLPDGASHEKNSTSIPGARVRDSILKVLTTCKADSLLTPEGKALLKKSLVDTLNKDVPELGVREIYFTEFLVQR